MQGFLGRWIDKDRPESLEASNLRVSYLFIDYLVILWLTESGFGGGIQSLDDVFGG